MTRAGRRVIEFFCLLFISRNMLKKYLTPLVLLLLLMVTSGNIFSQTKRRRPAVPSQSKAILAPPAPVQLTPEQEKRLEAFNTVWKTIKDNYFDQTFNGLNWENIRKEYQPRVLKASTSFEFHSVLQEMINRLNRSHFVIIPPEALRELEKAKVEVKKTSGAITGDDGQTVEGGEDGDEPETSDLLFDDADSKFGIGIDLRLINGQIVITEVEANSSADKAGLKTGFVIDKVNNVSLKDVLKRMLLAGAYGKLTEKVFSIVVLSQFINGAKESSVAIDYLDDKDSPKNALIKRERLNGKLIKPAPNFPKQFFDFESRSLNDDTGYVHFNMFAIPAVEGMCRALTDFKDKKAMIIDLRGNIGGSIGALIGIAGLLIDKPVILGTQIYKSSRENVMVSPQGRKYNGKLIVLMDSMSHSAAEIFASGLQENGRVKVVGEKSAGEALPSTTMMLATGAMFMYPFANFQTPEGNVIEGIGVQPDIKIGRERKTLLAGKDAQLDAAILLARSEVNAAANDKPVMPAAPPVVSAGMKAFMKELKDHSAPPAKIEKKYDEQALDIVAAAVAAAGGEDAINKLKTFSASGKVEITRAGTRVEGDIQLIGKTPDKNAEILNIDAVGEVRGIFDGKKYYLQSDLTGNSEYTDARQMRELSMSADLQEMVKIKEIYNQVLYVGEYQRKGKPAILVRAITADGMEIAFAFDKISRLLLQRTGVYANSSYDDYRKVGDVMVPFWQTRSDSMIIKLSEFKLNVPVEASFFVPRDNCFSVQKP
jgi:carboxyl-terminal processing protease